MLKLNAGISRKVGEPDYGSRGATVNLELEIESNLVSEPNALMDRIRRLFALARQAVDEELNGANAQGGHASSRTNGGNGTGRNGSGRNGTAHNGAAGTKPRPATAAQQRAIRTIADRLQLDADAMARQEFGADVADLSIIDASSLIDELKARNGGPR